MNFDLTAFGFSSDDSSMANVMSPRTAASSQSSMYPGKDQEEDEAEELEPAMPSYDTPGGDIGGFEIFPGVGTSSLARTGPVISSFDDEPIMADDLIFDVDDDGILRTIANIEYQTPGGNRTAFPPVDDDNFAVEPSEAIADDIQAHTELDDDNPISHDEQPALPAASDPPFHGQDDDEPELVRNSPLSVQPSEEASTTAAAPQRRARRVKSLRPDQYTELSNKDLKDWNENYLINMKAALRVKQQQISYGEARKYAGLWCVGQGLGRVAFAFANDNRPHPLTIFSGDSLWEMLRGSEPTSGAKRSHSQSEGVQDSDDDGRRVRAKTSSQVNVAYDLQEGDMMFGDADEGIHPAGDDFNIESQVGRHAPPSLQDYSSGMPWNMSASRPSSSHALGSGLMARLSSSVGGIPGGMALGPPSALGRHGSRLTSASPLLGRERSRLGSQETVDPSRLTIDWDEFANLDQQLGADVDVDFELYGPSAIVDTQTAQQSQWVTATLEKEAYNFLNFVQAHMRDEVRTTSNEGVEEEEEGQSTGRDSVAFSELLPPGQNSRVVAAQGMLHVLALATKGLLDLYQEVAFGEIEMVVTGK